MIVRDVDPPLGADAEDRPTLQEVNALWQAALAEPVPPYDGRPIQGVSRPAAAKA